MRGKRAHDRISKESAVCACAESLLMVVLSRMRRSLRSFLWLIKAFEGYFGVFYACSGAARLSLNEADEMRLSNELSLESRREVDIEMGMGMDSDGGSC